MHVCIPNMLFNDFYQINQKTPLSNKGMQTCILRTFMKLTKKQLHNYGLMQNKKKVGQSDFAENPKS